MRISEIENARRLTDALEAYEEEVGPLPGIALPGHRASFIEQLIVSDRRNRYVRRLVLSELSLSRSDPLSGRFDPLKAAILQNRAGSVDESFWMVFLFVHFGKHRTGGWRYAADVYGRLGAGTRWDWEHISTDVAGFRTWMDDNSDTIRTRGPGGFGNHRKYESLARTGAVVTSYVHWVGPSRSHMDRIGAALGQAAGDPRDAFGRMFRSMSGVAQFGRTARFDYLTNVSKLGLAPIRPDRAYLDGATGPLLGARLLFQDATGSSPRPIDLDDMLVDLERFAGIGIDALEDAVCNWQKSPAVFRPFRG